MFFFCCFESLCIPLKKQTVMLKGRCNIDLKANVRCSHFSYGVTQETSVNHIRYATHIHHLTRPTVKNEKKKVQNNSETGSPALLGLRIQPHGRVKGFILKYLRGDSRKQGRFKRNLLAINHVISRVRHLLVYRIALKTRYSTIKNNSQRFKRRKWVCKLRKELKFI